VGWFCLGFFVMFGRGCCDISVMCSGGCVGR